MKKPFDRGFPPFMKAKPPEIKMIHYYRYISYIMTSAFYIIGGESPFGRKAAVVLFLGVAAVILDYLYMKQRNNLRLIKLMILIETAGNIAILLPSGGLNSPYIWYSLNVVLVSSYFLSEFFLCINILIYIILSFVSFYLLQSAQLDIGSFLLDNSNLILSYILIIIAVNLLMKLARKINSERLSIERFNGELAKANKMLAESMNDITSLYQNLYAFVNVRNKEQIGVIIAEYTQKITKASFAFIYTGTYTGEFVLETTGQTDNKSTFIPALKERMNKLLKAPDSIDTAVRDEVAGKDIVMASVNSSNEVYGILGIEMNRSDGEFIDNQYMDQIKMLASLSAMLYERFKIEKMNRNLLVSEEQHRIANEIHDGVSQRLFYTLCKVGALTQQVSNINQTDIIAELNIIKESMKAAIKELRETIYSNGFNNSGMSSFEESISEYLGEICRLNDVHMDVKIKGSFEYIGYELKKVILRILGEACGNAIRHGKSKNISIELSRNIEKIDLEICDDGTGFDLNEKIRENSLGMGIKNMNRLVYSFNGSIEINSQLCKGTAISILLPLVCQNKGDKVV